MNKFFILEVFVSDVAIFEFVFIFDEILFNLLSSDSFVVKEQNVEALDKFSI